VGYLNFHRVKTKFINQHTISQLDHLRWGNGGPKPPKVSKIPSVGTTNCHAPQKGEVSRENKNIVVHQGSLAYKKALTVFKSVGISEIRLLTSIFLFADARVATPPLLRTGQASSRHRASVGYSQIGRLRV
jgi:hypothetical protein